MLDPLLMIPGPTSLPTAVREALARPMIGHRSEEFAELLADCRRGLQQVFQSRSEVIILAASGTGALEAALVNVLSAGDRVLALNCGYFGARWADMARSFGLAVEELGSGPGHIPDIERVAQALEANRFRAILATFNETSTGVTCPLAPLAELARERGALFLVDAVSGLGGIQLPTDELDLDVVAAGSQKCFMLPPGLSFVCAGPRAWEAMGQAALPRFYFDLRRYRDYTQRGQAPWTPPVSLMFGLQAALRMMLEEGLSKVFARHRRCAAAIRAGLTAMGFSILPDDEHASNTVTAAWNGEVDMEAVRKLLRKRYDIHIAGGQGELRGKIFRIGHMGAVSAREVLLMLAGLEAALTELGAPVLAGAALTAAQDCLTAKEAAVGAARRVAPAG